MVAVHHLEIFKTQNRLYSFGKFVPDYIVVGKTVSGLSQYFDFQDRGRPPS